MSCFLVNPKHIGQMAQKYPSQDADEISNVAITLANANLKSIASRYGDGDTSLDSYKKITLEWMDMEYSDYVASCCLNARPGNLDWNLNPIDIIKMCHCYDYQSCEADGYYESEAKRMVTWIEKDMIRKLPGYEDSPHWGYDGRDADNSKVLLSTLNKGE